MGLGKLEQLKSGWWTWLVRCSQDRQTPDVCWGRTWGRKSCGIGYTGSSCQQNGSACALWGWTCRRKLCRNGHSRRVFRLCATSSDLEEARGGRTACRIRHKHDSVCGSASAWQEQAWRRRFCRRCCTFWLIGSLSYGASVYAWRGSRMWHIVSRIQNRCISACSHQRWDPRFSSWSVHRWRKRPHRCKL